MKDAAPDEQAETIATSDPGSERTAGTGPDSTLPLPGWERFQILSFLGEGGMGRVYRARDPRLDREVAIKLLRGADPELAERLLREARSQARIEHEHVCQVFEAGQADGQPYIAMQLIDGTTLEQSADQMSPEEKLVVIRQVAEALQAAHRLGLIHRDIKPANILVEREPSGCWRPTVVDFGLVREVEAPGQTVSGMIVGTPAYMAPEQALGGRVDRRSDVYSLGATLYKVVTGRPPFVGVSSVKTLVEVLTQDPVPPRRLDPTLPADLEAIILTCLDKEPQRRYDSAQALADDLSRYLDGLPVQARRISAVERLLRLVRRHRTISVVLAASLVLVVAAAVFAITTALRSRERQALARRFGREVEAIETTLQVAYLLPVHDITSAKERVRERMAGIAAEMQRMGRAGQALGHAALGRGALALEEPALARSHLEQALASGADEAEVSVALGQALGRLYQADRRQALTITDHGIRSQRLAELEEELRAPALQALARGAELEPARAALVRGLMHLYEDRFEEAIKAGEEARRLGGPELYEALQLTGNTYHDQAILSLDSGRYELCEQQLDRAGEVYRQALEVGRSDPALWRFECKRQSDAMALRRRRGVLAPELLPAVSEACNTAMTVDPEQAEPLLLEARAEWVVAELEGERGIDPSPRLQGVIDLTKRAETLEPDNEKVFRHRGIALRHLAVWQADHGVDAVETLGAAVASLRHAVALAPDSIEAKSSLGAALWKQAEDEMQRGRDPGASLDEAAAVLQEATEHAPNANSVFNNLGLVHWRRAGWAQNIGADPTPALEAATAAFAEAIRIDPSDSSAQNNLGNVLFLQAMAIDSSGGDPRQKLGAAVAAYDRAIELVPDFAFPHKNSGIVSVARGLADAERGNDPSAAFAAAEQRLRRAREINPTYASAWEASGSLSIYRALWAMAHGQSPEADLQAAAAALDRALEISPGNGDFLRSRAEMWLAESRWYLARNRSPQPLLSRAHQAARKALQANPSDSEAWNDIGSLHLIEARWQAEQGNPWRPLLEQAETAFDQALQIDPTDTGALLGKVERRCLEARLGSTGEPLASAAELLAPVLEQHPTLTPAHALEAALKLAGVTTETAATDARRSLQELLDRAPLLRPRYAYLLDR